MSRTITPLSAEQAAATALAARNARGPEALAKIAEAEAARAVYSGLLKTSVEAAEYAPPKAGLEVTGRPEHIVTGLE
jgi:hypothetical protein